MIKNIYARFCDSSSYNMSRRGQGPFPHRFVCVSFSPNLQCFKPRLHCPVGWRASAYPCARLSRGQKPPGSTQAREHRGLRLSQSAVRVLRDHRCPRSRPGWRWQARPGRAHPDLSLPGLSHHLQCSTRHAVVSLENPFLLRRHGALSTGRRAGPFRSRADLRLSTSHHYHVADSRW